MGFHQSLQDPCRDECRLHMQAIEGENRTERPMWAEKGGLDFEGRARWDAWTVNKGMASDKAKLLFVKVGPAMSCCNLCYSVSSWLLVSVSAHDACACAYHAAVSSLQTTTLGSPSHLIRGLRCCRRTGRFNRRPSTRMIDSR